jgi:Fe-S cluster biogenesis protein NfuA
MIRERVEAVLQRVRPFLEADGGGIDLLGVEDRSAVVRLTGACASCPSAHITLLLGIEAELRRAIPDFDRLRVS